MKSLALVLCCFAALSVAQWQRPREDIVYEYLRNGEVICRINCRRPLSECPITNCPIPDKPELDRRCLALDCSNSNNRPFLFPTADPNYYYQCIRATETTWEAIRRPCGCETLFDYAEQRCVHPHEFVQQCDTTPNPLPPVNQCPLECPTCDNGSPPVVVPPVVVPPVVVPPVVVPPVSPPVTPPSNCPCVPCIWFPCQCVC